VLKRRLRVKVWDKQGCCAVRLGMGWDGMACWTNTEAVAETSCLVALYSRRVDRK